VARSRRRFEAAASRKSGRGVETAFGKYREAKYIYDRHVDVHGPLDWIGDVVDRRRDCIRSRAIFPNLRKRRAGHARFLAGSCDFPFWRFASDLRSRRDPAGGRDSRIGGWVIAALFAITLGIRASRSSLRIALKSAHPFSAPLNFRRHRR